jgi:hypothetical protein
MEQVRYRLLVMSALSAFHACHAWMDACVMEMDRSILGLPNLPPAIAVRPVDRIQKSQFAFSNIPALNFF